MYTIIIHQCANLYFIIIYIIGDISLSSMEKKSETLTDIIS